MTSLAEALRALCDKHDLTSISINVDSKPDRRLTAYVHWGKDKCVHAWGVTAEEAIANTINAANEARNVAADVPDLSLGEVVL